MTPTPSTAEPADVEQRAREMLAAEYDLLNYPGLAKSVRERECPKIDFPFAIRAITRALQSTDEVVEVLERLRPLFKRHPSPHVNDQTLNDIQALLLKLKGQSK